MCVLYVQLIIMADNLVHFHTFLHCYHCYYYTAYIESYFLAISAWTEHVMGAFKLNLCKFLKIVFIIVLLVRFRSLCNQLSLSIKCKVTYLWLIFLPSVFRFLSDEVVVAASTQSDPLSTPAVTFCPYDQSK